MKKAEIKTIMGRQLFTVRPHDDLSFGIDALPPLSLFHPRVASPALEPLAHTVVASLPPLPSRRVFRVLPNSSKGPVD